MKHSKSPGLSNAMRGFSLADSTKKVLQKSTVQNEQWQEWSPFKAEAEGGGFDENDSLEGDVLSCQDELGMLAAQVSKHNAQANAYTATFSSTPILTGRKASATPQQPAPQPCGARQPSPGYSTVCVTPIQQPAPRDVPVRREVQPPVGKPLLPQFEVPQLSATLLPASVRSIFSRLTLSLSLSCCRYPNRPWTPMETV